MPKYLRLHLQEELFWHGDKKSPKPKKFSRFLFHRDKITPLVNVGGIILVPCKIFHTFFCERMDKFKTSNEESGLFRRKDMDYIVEYYIVFNLKLDNSLY